MYDDTRFYEAQDQQNEDEYREAVAVSAYEPLHVMVTTGPARLDNDGTLVESGEYVAALYESYAADQEMNYGYATVAQEVAEDLWTRDLHDVA